jgi:hypothetical protein
MSAAAPCTLALVTLRTLFLGSFGVGCATTQEATPAPVAREQGDKSDSNGSPRIEDKTEGMERIDGFLPLFWEESTGKLWMEIAKFDTDLLMVQGLAAGLGSNDIGLDRGQVHGSRLVQFQRVGPKVLLVQPNLRFRAQGTRAEVRAVTDAFAPSVLWGFAVAAATDERVLVDLSKFLLRDATGIASRLSPGSYRFDESRSAIYRAGVLGFPKNTEMEALVTFARTPGGGGGGRRRGAFEGVGSVAASGAAATLRVHHSFAALPEEPFVQRRYDPNAGFSGFSYQDYTAPLGEPLTVRFLSRHRLEKVDPSADRSEAVEPIVYYLDPGAPEPMRQALLDGARWWNQRLPGGAPARGSPSPGPALQRDQLGAPVDTRLELRRQRLGSAHRRDPERCRDPGLLARAPGLAHRRRAAGALRQR